MIGRRIISGSMANSSVEGLEDKSVLESADLKIIGYCSDVKQ